MTHENPSVKKVAIFDRHFRNNKSLGRVAPELLDVERRHDIVAHANSLADSVELLLELSRASKDELPDVMITAGTLDGEISYVNNPIIESVKSPKTVRSLRGKRIVNVEESHYLLPIVDEEGGVTLPPASSRSAVLDHHYIRQFNEGYYRGRPGAAMSGFVIAHLAKELPLHETKIIGYASGWFGKGVPLDAFVPKGGNGGRTLLEEVQIPFRL